MGLNLGKFVGSAAVSAIKEWNPLGPEAIVRRAENKAFRQAFRKARKGKDLTPEEEKLVAAKTVTVTLPDGSKYEREEPIIDAMTSTKVGVTGVALGLPIIQGIQEIEWPWPWLESLTNSDVFVQLATLAVAYVVAKLSKSPSRPK